MVSWPVLSIRIFKEAFSNTALEDLKSKEAPIVLQAAYLVTENGTESWRHDRHFCPPVGGPMTSGGGRMALLYFSGL